MVADVESFLPLLPNAGLSSTTVLPIPSEEFLQPDLLVLKGFANLFGLGFAMVILYMVEFRVDF